MGEIIAFIIGVTVGVLILGLVKVGSQKEKEQEAYKAGYNAAISNNTTK